MPNTIKSMGDGYNQKLTDTLDKVLVQKAVTGHFADNALRAKFVGAKTVFIPEVDMAALADYDRENGFTRGPITVSNTPFTMQMDRGRSNYYNYYTGHTWGDMRRYDLTINSSTTGIQGAVELIAGLVRARAALEPEL